MGGAIPLSAAPVGPGNYVSQHAPRGRSQSPHSLPAPQPRMRSLAPSVAVALLQDPRAGTRQPAAVGLAQRSSMRPLRLRLAGAEGVRMEREAVGRAGRQRPLLLRAVGTVCGIKPGRGGSLPSSGPEPRESLGAVTDGAPGEGLQHLQSCVESSA